MVGVGDKEGPGVPIPRRAPLPGEDGRRGGGETGFGLVVLAAPEDLGGIGAEGEGRARDALGRFEDGEGDEIPGEVQPRIVEADQMELQARPVVSLEMALHSCVERYCSSVLSTRNTFSTLELNSEAGTSP